MASETKLHCHIFCEKICLGIWNVKKGLDIIVIQAPFYIGETFWKVEQYGWIISAGLCLSSHLKETFVMISNERKINVRWETLK